MPYPGDVIIHNCDAKVVLSRRNVFRNVKENIVGIVLPVAQVQVLGSPQSKLRD